MRRGNVPRMDFAAGRFGARNSGRGHPVAVGAQITLAAIQTMGPRQSRCQVKQRVVVIGSGLAGSLISNDLAGDADVTLLEIGAEHSLSYPPIENVHRELAGVPTFCYGGGGTTNLWHNGLIPINLMDVHSPVFRKVLASAATYMDRAAARLRFPHPRFADAYEEAVAEVSGEGRRLGAFEHGLDCLIYPKKFTRLRPEPGVKAFYGVNSIDFNARGNAIETVTLTDGAGTRTLPTDVVVISSGALGSPKLVRKIHAATGRTDPTLGSGLIDHPLGFVGKARFRREHCATMRRFSLLDKGDYTCCTAARIKSQCGRYTCFAFVRPALTMCNDLAIYKYKSLLGASSRRDRIRHALSPRIAHPDILAEIFAHLTGAHLPSRVFNILVYFEQRRGGNRVDYDADRVRVDWRISEEELAVYNEMLGSLRRQLEPLVDEIVVQMPITDEWLWSGAHHSGTISLSEDESGIVDADLKIRGCVNAFVCDGSVVQEHSYANTGLTIGQLALRLADRVRAAGS